MRTLPVAIAALAIFTLATSAAAQDGSQDVTKRTPENAHLFLGQVLAGMKTGSAVNNFEAAGLSSNAPLIWVEIVNWSATNLCNSTYRTSAHPGGQVQTPIGTGTFGPVAAGYFALDWSTVTDIRQAGADLILGSKSAPIFVRTPSETMAGRVGTAMQLIVDTCDPAKESGF